MTPLEQLRVWTARPDWMDQASCRGMGPNLWFPEQGGVTDEAKQVCANCPVTTQCQEAGRDERFGIWGGGSGRTRRIERAIISTRPRPPINHGTVGGYLAHGRRGEPLCQPCRDANSAYERNRRQAS